MIGKEEDHRHDSYLGSLGSYLLDQRDEAGNVDISGFDDELLERFFSAGWVMGKLYAEYERTSSSSRGPG